MDICNKDFMTVYGLIGMLLKILKIGVPIIIIGLGTFDLYQAVVSSENDALKKKSIRLIWRIVAGIIIFFLPSLILFLFDAVGLDHSEASCAYNCILDNNCKSTTNGNLNNGNNANTNNGTTNNEECTIEDESCISKAIFIDK